ncbi:Imm71 family immunity protein, partial [Caballeronia grimmiae]
MPTDFLIAGKNDDEARDRSFYLLKKYTSATLMRRAIDLYREFLHDFEREIKRPELASNSMQSSYHKDVLYFLRYLRPMEYAEPLIANSHRRTEAFALLREAVDFSAFMWGRRYQEWGASEPGSPFYALGYRYLPWESIDVFGKAQQSAVLISLMSTTLCLDGTKQGVAYLGSGRNARSVMRWTYESIFFDSLPLNGIPPLWFPPHLPSCPP